MEQPSYVVVFPTVLSRGRIPQLISNIKKILSARNQQFRTVRRDGDVIVIDAADPVFASSAVSLLFGIERLAIAQRVANNFESVVSGIASVAENLLLSRERFLVRVDGRSGGFTPGDAELAATSEIIGRKSGAGIRPGTGHNHDRILYCHLTGSNAYVCIFMDDGRGGVPFRSDIPDAVCCIFDELSAVSCYETMRQGFNPKIIVCYTKKPELAGIAKMINRLLPRLLRQDVALEIFRLHAGRGSYQGLVGTVLEILLGCARSSGISHVSVPVSPMIFSMEFTDHVAGRIFESGLMPVMPLSGLDSATSGTAAELGLKGQPRYAGRGLQHFDAAQLASVQAGHAIKSRQEIRIRVGPNNIHDILDLVEH